MRAEEPQEHCRDVAVPSSLVGGTAITLFQMQGCGWQPLLGGDATCTQTCPADPCIWLEALALFWTGVNISGDAPITLSTRGDGFCQGPRLRCGLGLSQAGSPALQHGRIRITPPSCNRLPGDLPAFPNFLCYKLCYSKKLQALTARNHFTSLRIAQMSVSKWLK